jgi:hypothetical protein
MGSLGFIRQSYLVTWTNNLSDFEFDEKYTITSDGVCDFIHNPSEVNSMAKER